MTGNYNLPLIITLDFCVYRPSSFYIIDEWYVPQHA